MASSAWRARASRVIGAAVVVVALSAMLVAVGSARGGFNRVPRPRWRALGPFSTSAYPLHNPNPAIRRYSVVSGRVDAIVAQENTCLRGSCRVLYVGSAEGGVWKTVDGGRRWRALTDGVGSLGTGVLAVDQLRPEQVYVGTGEHLIFGNALAGVGVIHSGDGGATWQTLGSGVMKNRAVTGLVLDPRTLHSQRPTLYATTSYANAPGSSTDYWDTPLSPGTSPAGFLRSTDGGRRWVLSNPRGVDASSSGADSLAIDPQHPNTLYAGFVQTVTPAYVPGLTLSAVPTGAGARRLGLYKSTDDGRHWSYLSGGGVLPVTDAAAGTLIDATRVVVAPSDGRVVYAAFSLGAFMNENLLLFRSDDGGVTWRRLSNTPNACGTIGAGGQCFFDMTLAVDPRNANVVYVGGIGNGGYLVPRLFPNSPCADLARLPAGCQVTVARSIDGGRSWADVGSNPSGAPLHGDNHFTYVPATDPNAVYDGDDGGLWHSANGGRSWQNLNTGLDTMLFYSVAVGPSGAVYGGTQDNGLLRYTGSARWNIMESADAGMALADPSDPRRLYWVDGGTTLWRDDHALSTYAPQPGNANAPYPATNISPMLQDPRLNRFPIALAPSRTSMILVGTDRLWRSLKRGGVDGNHDGSAYNDRSDTDDWVPISPHLGAGSFGFGAGAPMISAIAVSPIDANVVAFGMGDGRIYLSTNAAHAVSTSQSCDATLNPQNPVLCNLTGGVSWRKVSLRLPGRFVSSLRFAPQSSSTLYAVFSNYSANTPGHPGHLFVSTDRGAHWRRIDRALPDVPFSDVAISPLTGDLYAAANYHVFVSQDHGRHWNSFDGTLPHATVSQLAYWTRPRPHAGPRGYLFAATLGRGIWQTPAP